MMHVELSSMSLYTTMSYNKMFISSHVRIKDQLSQSSYYYALAEASPQRLRLLAREPVQHEILCPIIESS